MCLMNNTTGILEKEQIIEDAKESLLNLFGICTCCKRLGAVCNETNFCDECSYHITDCNPNFEDAIPIMLRVMKELMVYYAGDEEFFSRLHSKK